MAGATKTRARGRTGAVATRVDALREQGERDPVAARDEAWGWIEELGRRAESDRDAALNELQELFLSGEPATGINGQTEGLLVTWTINPVADKLIGAITNAWMPWLGKKFDPDHNRGINTLTTSAQWPARLLWPLYTTREDPLGRAGFEFATYVEPGLLDPSVNVLVIDYASIPDNPRLLVRQIRDELVQIVPGANLGKMLVKMPRRTQPVLGLYFALKS